MNNQLFLSLMLLCITTHLIRAVYEILKHRKIIKANTFSFIIIFTNMMLLWTSWFMLCRFDPSTLLLVPVFSYFGIALVIAGVVIFLAALFTIKTLETYDGSLITSGIYSSTRHPMYLAFLLWLIGMPLYYGGLYSLLLMFPFGINVLFWRHLEEHELITRSPNYLTYKQKTFF